MHKKAIFVPILYSKLNTMIIVQEIGSLYLTAYSTLVKACKFNNWSYIYLRHVKLNNKPKKYKGYYLYKV